MLDGSETVAATYTYAPFGNLMSQTGSLSQPFKFSTKMYDDQTSLSYFGYRFYSPALGRWTTRDPIGYAGGMNLYAYAADNPLMLIDPWGLLLTDAEIANIIFNETRSFSGPNLDQERENIAHAIINGDEALGDKRPRTGPTTATVPAVEQPAYSACQSAVTAAREARTQGEDPTNGAMNFNFRNNDSTAPFYKLPLQTQVGPLNNSYTRGGLNATGVYANTYGVNPKKNPLENSP